MTDYLNMILADQKPSRSTTNTLNHAVPAVEVPQSFHFVTESFMLTLRAIGVAYTPLLRRYHVS